MQTLTLILIHFLRFNYRHLQDINYIQLKRVGHFLLLFQRILRSHNLTLHATIGKLFVFFKPNMVARVITILVLIIVLFLNRFSLNTSSALIAGPTLPADLAAPYLLLHLRGNSMMLSLHGLQAFVRLLGRDLLLCGVLVDFIRAELVEVAIVLLAV